MAMKGVSLWDPFIEIYHATNSCEAIYERGCSSIKENDNDK